MGYSALSFIALSIGSIAYRDLVLLHAPHQHLKYIKRVSAAFTPHQICQSIKGHIWAGVQVAYMLRVNTGVTNRSNSMTFNGSNRSVAIVVKASFHGLSVATSMTSVLSCNYGAAG